MVVWLVWRAIGESDRSDRLKSSTNLRGPKWLKKVTVYSHASIGGFGEGVPLENQWDHKQSAYNVKTQEDSVVVVEESNSCDCILK
jgi:hypothetical protein